MKKIKNNKLTSPILIALSFLFSYQAKAFSIMEETGSACLNDGDCKLNDFVRLGIAATKLFLGLSGSVALLFFIYGGVMFLISAGNPERVSKGKQILISSVIGIVIVFTSYTIIGFVLGALGVEGGENWFTSTSLREK